jgi:hypothetical protein
VRTLNHPHVSGKAAHQAADTAVELLHEIRDTLKAIAAAQAVAPKLVGEREAARILGVSERTVWGLNAAGKLRCVWLADRVNRYAVADLEKYVDRLRAEAAAEGSATVSA